MAGHANTDFETTWRHVQEGVDRLLHMQPMTNVTYVGYYTSLFNYCTNPGQVETTLHTTAPDQAEGRFYHKLKDHLERHLGTLAVAMQDLSGEALISFYGRQWARYTESLRLINRLLQYLNRYWVPKQIADGRKDIRPLYGMGLIAWRTVVFEKMLLGGQQRLSAAICKMIDSERDGNVVDREWIIKAVASYRLIDLDDHDISRTRLELYNTHFMGPFSKSTSAYYVKESEAHLAVDTVSAYIDQAFKRLIEEEARADILLHPTSKDPLIKTVEDALIRHHTELFQTEFEACLSQHNSELITKVYNLLRRLPNGLEPLRKLYERVVHDYGLSSIAKVINLDAELNTQLYIASILAVYKPHNTLVNVSLAEDTGFRAALDRATKEFINRNAVTQGKTIKSAELVAKFTDVLLKKGNKGAEADLRDDLNDAFTVFKYLEDKDAFQKFYSKLLSKRLIYGASVSDDAEADMISHLKDACGSEYTRNLQKMFQDISLCAELNQEFRDHTARVKGSADGSKAKSGLEAHYLVLGISAWPSLSAPSNAITPPRDLLLNIERFKAFYNRKFTGRKLTIHWGLSRNEIRPLYTAQKYIFSTSSVQAVILMQYNGETDALELSHLQAATGIEAEALQAQLDLLVKLGVLTFSDDEYALNLNFKSKKLRVPLNQTIKSDARKENADVLKNVESDRVLVIDACLVRLMKARKQMKHSDLVNDCTEQISSRFRPDVSLIKRAIESLIDRDYIKRAEGQRDRLEYVA